MNLSHHLCKRLGICLLGAFVVLICLQPLSAQKREADSLKAKLSEPLYDTERVITMRGLSYAMYKYNADSALTVAYEGLEFARQIKYEAGISRMYEMIANILTKTGNYNKAIAYYIENLKIEEALHSPDGIILANNNMGTAFVYMFDYDNALRSYQKAHTLLASFQTKDTAYHDDLTYMINVNLGDVYERTKQLDSSFLYYNNALNIAMKQKDMDKIGVPMLGLANLYAAMKSFELSLANYRVSMGYLLSSNNEELLCDVCLGMAKVFDQLHQTDSTFYYARQGLFYAEKNKFLAKQQEISSFLSLQFAALQRIDSAYTYLTASNQLRDSLLSIEKLRLSERQIFDENVRQLELLAKAAREKEERRQQLQHIFIGLLIPGLFLLTALLTRIRIKIKLIKFLGVISLLFLFEYLTLLLHPVVQHITHHSPVFEILIFVAIAGLLIPLHHRLEHWMIDKLVRRVQSHDNNLMQTAQTQTAATIQQKELPLSAEHQKAHETSKAKTKSPKKRPIK